MSHFTDKEAEAQRTQVTCQGYIASKWQSQDFRPESQIPDFTLLTKTVSGEAGRKQEVIPGTLEEQTTQDLV